jgi:polymorphic toxin system DSP-PTPase phosphatase-like protein
MSDIYPVREFESISLAIMPRPRAGDWLEDEISSWQRAEIRTIVSLLEPQELVELGLSDEPRLCLGHGIEFVSFPIPDRGVPTSYGTLNLLVMPLVPKVKGGHMVAVHCRAGIGRSGVVAAGILFRSGIPFPQIFPALSRARGVAVPDTDAQTDWVQAYAHSDRS